MKKIVINESQYNRLFNKPKTKVILTEAQFNRLLVENEIQKNFSEIKLNDFIVLTIGTGDELHFKVVSSDSGQLMLINTDSGVYSNAYIFLNHSSLNSNNLSYDFKQKSQIKGFKDEDGRNDTKKALDDYKSDPKNWKKNTIKNIKSFKVFDPSKKPKFLLDLKMGGKVEPKKKEDFQSSEATPEIESLVAELDSMKEDKTYRFTLHNGNIVEFLITKVGGNSVGMEMTNGTGVYENMVGYTFEWNSTHENVNFRAMDDFDIQLTMFDSKEDKSDSKELKMKSRKVEIIHIKDFGDSSVDGPKGGSEEDSKEGSNIRNLSDEEVKAKVTEFMANDTILKNAIYKRPNSLLELLGLAKKRGIVPAEGRLGVWANKTAGKAKKELLMKDFPGNKEILGTLSELRIDGNVDEKLGNVISVVRSKDNRDIKAKVKPAKAEDKSVILGTNLEGDLRSEEDFKYRIFIINELEDNERFQVYKIEIFYKESKNKAGTEIATGKMQINKPTK